MRACDEVQGTLALTVQGRGLESKIAASQDQPFLESECVSCGACVEACPTTALMEKSVIRSVQPERAITTTCAYCGVGCSFEAEVRGSDARPRSCAWCRAATATRTTAMPASRAASPTATRRTRPHPQAHDPQDHRDDWREVSWEEAIAYAASEIRRIQAKYGRDSIGGITSSRCTNEETFLVQKMVRAAFGNNNVDTCARVCHSPTGYGLKSTIGESAGTQAFTSVAKADVIMVVGANPTEGHPVFGSQMKQRLRQGAKLIVARPALHRASCAARTSRRTSTSR